MYLFRKTTALILYLFSFFTQAVTAGELPVRYLGIEQGLSNNAVTSICQDHNGFLWIGTYDGLNRYDGKNFLLFTRQRNGLQSNRVLKLATDAGYLFIMYGDAGYHLQTSGMVDVMNLSTFRVQSLSATFPDMPFKEKDVRWIANDGTDKLIFLTCHPFRLWHY